MKIVEFGHIGKIHTTKSLINIAPWAPAGNPLKQKLYVRIYLGTGDHGDDIIDPETFRRVGYLIRDDSTVRYYIDVQYLNTTQEQQFRQALRELG